MSSTDNPAYPEFAVIRLLDETLRELVDENHRLRMGIALAIARIERHEAGAALTGLQAVLDA